MKMKAPFIIPYTHINHLLTYIHSIYIARARPLRNFQPTRISYIIVVLAVTPFWIPKLPHIRQRYRPEHPVLCNADSSKNFVRI